MVLYIIINNNFIELEPSCSWQSIPLTSEIQNDDCVELSFNEKLVLGRYIFLFGIIIL